MSFFNFIWLFINILLILLILLRSPNEQSIQETRVLSKLFESSINAEKNLDKLIQFFILIYFIFGFLLTIINY
jgi:preprotein translocase subunit SecG